MPDIFRLLGGAAPSHNEDIVLAPLSINPRSEPALQPDEFKLQGKAYVRCCSLAKNPKLTKKRNSIIWIYGEDIQLRTNSAKRFWYCYLCEKRSRQQELPVVDKGNSTCLDHLKQAHKIDPKTGERITTCEANQTTINGPSVSNLIFRRDWEFFKELLIRWIVCCHIAFFQIENEYFREMLFYARPWLSEFLPKAGRTVRKWVMATFTSRKGTLKKELNEARGRISISFDAWTSPSCVAILGVVAHFIDKTGKRRTAVLALRRLRGVHSGENMAEVMVQIFREYGITRQIGFFMGDNHDANDTCTEAVLQELFPLLTAKQRKRRRLRCAGHIINLCAHAFLMGTDAEHIAREMDTALREGDLKKVGDLWRKRGALGKLHNLIKYIRHTPGRRDFFEGLSGGEGLEQFDGLQVSEYSILSSSLLHTSS
jgi:hypothetical protein